MPESLVNRLGPLAMETAAAAPVAPSSNVRERLGTAPPPRTQPLESRLGISVDQNRNNSQTVSRKNDPPDTANPASAAGPSTSAVPAEGVEPGSVLLWNRSDPSHWGQYKTDMSTKLNMNTLTCREDAMRMIGGESPTVSRLYRIPGVDWLLAEQEQFSSTTTLRHADLNGLPQDNTFGPLNTRSLTDVRQRARELTPPARKGKFRTDNKPNNKHHKMYRQFAKPPGQTPGEYSRDYPRTTTVDGDDRRYGKLKAPVDDGLFAAYDPLDMKAAKYLIVASSDYLYTPRSLFWPDVIFLTAPKLDWGQAIGMMISVQRLVSMEPQVIVVAGSNDHLQSRGLLTRLTDGSIPSNEVIGEAIMTLLSAMAEVETAAKQRFTQNLVKVVFVLSPGYAAFPEPLQFVYTMVTTIAEGRFNVIIPAPNRVVDPDNYYPSRSELPAVWADISNAIQGLKDCSTIRLVLDEVLGLELSNFARLMNLRPGVDDDHLLVQQVADDLWFRQMDHAENEQGRTVRKNMTSAEEDLMAKALRTKPHNNLWLYLSPILCTLGEDAFEHAPAVIKEIHVYLKNLFDARELAGGMMLKLMQDVNTMSLDKFQADVLATRAQYEQSDAILGGMGVGWTPSFLSTCYPRASRNLIASFVKDIRKLSIGLILDLYVTFGHENFVKGPANLFTQALSDLRLDLLLTLIAMTYGRLGDLLVLLRYPEQLQGTKREFNAQLETASLRKMKDWRTILLQYLLPQNRSVTGEDKVATDAGECKQYCGMPLLTDLAVMIWINPLALIHGLREFVTVVYGPVMSFAFPDVQVKAYRNANDDELMDQDDDDIGGKTEKQGETDLGALERDLLEYRLSEDDDGEVDGSLLLMTPSSFMSPTKEASADLSPMDPISQARECRGRDPQRLLHESPRRRKIEESMRVSFLSTLTEEEWERYQSELEGKTGATWSRVNFMERSWDVIRRYGTQSIMKVGLNQPIMREVLEKIMNSMESDVLTDSVTEDSADDQQVTKKLPVRRARKGLKRLKGKTGSRAVNQRVVKSKASAVVASLTSAGRSGESGQGDGATLTRGEKENLIPPMLLAGLPRQP